MQPSQGSPGDNETGAAVVVMSSSVRGEKGVSDYFQLFDYDVALLTRALGSKP